MGGRERGGTPPQKNAEQYLGAGASAGGHDGDDASGEMCQELMEIFQGSPRCAPSGPTDCSAGSRDTLQPPSRNQNPLVKDQVRAQLDERFLGFGIVLVRVGQTGGARAVFANLIVSRDSLQEWRRLGVPQ